MENEQPNVDQAVEPKTFSAEYVRELREEAKTNRLKLKELQDKEAQERQNDLLKKGEYEKLLKEKEEQIKALMGEKDVADQYRNQTVESAKKMLESIPENFKHVFDFNPDELGFKQAKSALELYSKLKKANAFEEKQDLKIPVGEITKTLQNLKKIFLQILVGGKG